MRKDENGKALLKVILFLISLVIAFLFFSFVMGKNDVIRDNEVGVVAGKDGSYKIYTAGEKPQRIPFYHEFYRISIAPRVVTLAGVESVSLKKEKDKELKVESQITYIIDDVDKVIKRFGYKEPHLWIREKIKEMTSKLIKEHIKDIDALEKNPKERITLMAQMHIKINEMLKDDGVKVNSFQIRFE